MPSYAELRQQVVAQLRPDADHLAVLQSVAHAAAAELGPAVSGAAQAAALDVLTAGAERSLLFCQRATPKKYRVLMRRLPERPFRPLGGPGARGDAPRGATPHVRAGQGRCAGNLACYRGLAVFVIDAAQSVRAAGIPIPRNCQGYSS
jgi:hypothetical protein